MCYELKQSEVKLLTAEEDIQCFKTGFISYGIFRSAYKGIRYKFGQVMSCPNFISKLRLSPTKKDTVLTTQGLYSYATLERAQEGICYMLEGTQTAVVFGYRIYKAIIPKGAQYLRHKDCFISDQLMVIDEAVDWFPELNEEFIKIHGEKIYHYVPESYRKIIEDILGHPIELREGITHASQVRLF